NKMLPHRALRASVSQSIVRSLSSSTSRDLPDYGKTTLDVSSIRLSKIDKAKVDRISKNKWRRKDLDGKSLISDTLVEMEQDVDFKRTLNDLKVMGKKKMTLEERKNRRRALDNLSVPSFKDFVKQQQVKENAVATELTRNKTTVFQLNIGLYCNQACGHCHVESSPRRKEMMDIETADRCLKILANSPHVTTLDITGGAPELNATFRHIVKEARRLRPDLDIIDRCNLTVVHEPGQEDLIDFLVEHSALLAFNEAGYSDERTGLVLDLVYNPLGAFLPPPQESLEQKYKEELMDTFGISFNNLYTMTNIPVKRFADFLHRRGELEEYMDLLVRNFNLDTTENLMCMETVSVGWDGKIYDCDFNQQLGFGMGCDVGKGQVFEGGKTVLDIEGLDELAKETIAFDNHCYGCTAGMGSS
ncbi:hypothetical protein TrCOL_g1471, partial [Triparma columacea]